MNEMNERVMANKIKVFHIIFPLDIISHHYAMEGRHSRTWVDRTKVDSTKQRWLATWHEATLNTKQSRVRATPLHKSKPIFSATHGGSHKSVDRMYEVESILRMISRVPKKSKSVSLRSPHDWETVNDSASKHRHCPIPIDSALVWPSLYIFFLEIRRVFLPQLLKLRRIFPFFLPLVNFAVLFFVVDTLRDEWSRSTKISASVNAIETKINSLESAWKDIPDKS